jgi:hypothetical protein
MGRAARDLGVVGMKRLAAAEVARAWAERTCAEQGLSVKVTDGAAVEKTATLLGQTRQTGSMRSGSKAVRPRRAG